jgi:hypothetical protein
MKKYKTTLTEAQINFLQELLRRVQLSGAETPMFMQIVAAFQKSEEELTDPPA